jgi:hypothetical protein
MYYLLMMLQLSISEKAADTLQLLLQSEEKTIMSYEAQQNAFTDENKPSRS